jgi:purine-nucleoside phosphorylase
MLMGIPAAGFRTGRMAGGLLIALLLVAGGCGTTPPVQEMSDARQAIAAAKEAGAEQMATEDFRAAEAFLDSAQRKLSERAYAQARRDALQAKAKAHDALALIESAASEPR